jgi:hypothetical protein
MSAWFIRALTNAIFEPSGDRRWAVAQYDRQASSQAVKLNQML